MAFHMNFNLDFPSSLTAEPLDDCRGGIGNPFHLLNRIFREDDLGANETDVVVRRVQVEIRLTPR